MSLHRFGIISALAVLPVAAQVSRHFSSKTDVEAARYQNGPVKDLRVRPDGSVVSGNWSGYVATGQAGAVTDAKASWTVPAVSCSGTGNARSFFWVGIDGYPDTAPTLEQIGTESDCVDGTPFYQAWYEFLPQQQSEQPISAVQVHPGDRISAEVSYSSGQFTVSITDETNDGQSFSTTETVAGALRSSVEWIAEAPAISDVVQPLANFGIGRFGYDNTGVAGTCDATVGAKTGTIGGLSNVSALTMIDEGSSDEAVPSPLSPDGSSFSVRTQPITLLSFDGTDGADPIAGLVQATNGDFYGTTVAGGANGTYGTVFKITPSGALTTLYSFCAQSGCTDGSGPGAALVQAANGDFYGTSGGGGANGGGTVFKITPSGALTTLYSFCSQSGCTDGTIPYAGLVQATDGYLYGTSGGGGANGGGTVFKITPGGALTTLYSFCAQSGCTDGTIPYAGLVQATDGYLYGTTSSGGAYNGGTVFKITPTGTLTTLYSFCRESGCADGGYPYAGLVQTTNGDLYGVTTSGGSGADGGTVFKITPTGTLTTLYSFCRESGCADGFVPWAGLVQATNGNLYGTTSGGGAYNGGTVFKITPTGTLTTLYSFCSQTNCADGVYPDAGLVQATNGDLYGATTAGGGEAFNGGTVFSLSVGLGPFVETQPTSGGVGAVVKILGTDLTGATSVSFNSTAAVFTVVSPSLITTTVPVGATTGKVEVVTPSGTLSSNVPFRVLP